MGTNETSGRYLSPGVYMEEVSSGSRPLEGVGTAIAAFVGFAEENPVRAAATVLLLALGLAVVVRAVRSSR